MDPKFTFMGHNTEQRPREGIMDQGEHGMSYSHSYDCNSHHDLQKTHFKDW